MSEPAGNFRAKKQSLLMRSRSFSGGSFENLFGLPASRSQSVQGINEVVNGIPFPHQGGAKVGLVACEEILEL